MDVIGEESEKKMNRRRIGEEDESEKNRRRERREKLEARRGEDSANLGLYRTNTDRFIYRSV